MRVSSEGGIIEAAKATIHSAQATPGASQFYFSIPLIGLSLLAGGGKKVTAVAITAGTLIGTLFSNWKEVSSAYRNGSDLTGVEVATEAVSFAGQTALMIASGFVGAPVGKLSSLVASNLARGVNYRCVPIINASIEKITRTTVQLFVSGAGVYGFAVATHFTTAGINKGLGQENAFHDFWGQVNHLFLFMAIQQVVGLTGIGQNASSLAGKSLRWCGNTMAASLIMQMRSSSLTDLLIGVGNESRDLALLHLGGKAFPHTLPIFHDAMRRWGKAIEDNQKVTQVKIHEARLINEARWREDPVYRHQVQMAAMTAGLALMAATGNPPNAFIPCSVVWKTPQWPHDLDTKSAWNIYKEIYIPSKPDEKRLSRRAFDLEFSNPKFRDQLFNDLGDVASRVSLAVIWEGSSQIKLYNRLFGLITANRKLEQACWDHIQNEIPLWRTLELNPEKYFFELLRAQADLETLQAEAGSGVFTPQLLEVNSRIVIQRTALMAASREARILYATERAEERLPLERATAIVDGILSSQLAYIVLKRLDCDTGRYLRPSQYMAEMVPQAFREAYEGLQRTLERLYLSEPGDMATLPRIVTEAVERLKRGKGKSYNGIADELIPEHLLPSLSKASTRQIALLYIHLLTNPPGEGLAIKRIKEKSEAELDTFRRDRQEKNPSLREELIETLATAEFIADAIRHHRYHMPGGGTFNDLARLQVASLAHVLMPLARKFGAVRDTAWAREEETGAWHRYVNQNVKEEYIRNEILHPLVYMMAQIRLKGKTAARDSVEAAYCQYIADALQMVYEDIKDLTGINPTAN